ncbi:MAG: helix-hairpin-helix domain-containing protein [Coriobacteriaceae bacterium]|nr:helix-hairpin-helix domain-containing protein [Coriobacteriaceae bacterium]
MGARDQFDLKLNCFLRRLGLSRVPRSVVVCLLIICVGIVGFGIWRFWPGDTSSSDDFEVSLTDTASAADADEEEGTEEETGVLAVESVTVDVGGAVRHPGVYVLDAGQRIDDALDAAGGTKKDAAVSVINRALELEDGAQIYVPTKKQVWSGRYRKLLEAGTVASFGSVTAGTPQTAGASSDSTAGTGSTSSSGSSGAAGESDTLININTADESELQQLSGIGEVLSAQIVSYREENGNFSSIEDIKNVSGIGDARFAAIADSICV